MPLRIHGIASGAALRRRVRRAARARRALPVPRPALPARVLGRAAPADRARARARDEPAPGRVRRARVGARRLDPGADPEPAARPAARAAPDARLHRARPRRRAARLGPRGGDVPRPDRRAGARRRAVRAPGAPVQRGAALGRPGSRSRTSPTAASCSRATCRARSTRPPAAGSTRAAATRPSSAASTTLRLTTDGGKAASDRLPPSARSTHRACCAVVSSARAIIEVEGLRKAYGETIALAGVDLEVPAGHGARSARPERRRQDDDRPRPRDPADSRRGSRPHRRRRRRRATRRSARRLLGLAGQYAAVDETLTGRENLEMIGQLYGLRRKDAKIRAAEALDASQPDRRVRAPRAHLLGRHAATTRPRREPRRPTAGAADGRADDRPRPAHAHRSVGAHRRARGTTGRRCS